MFLFHSHQNPSPTIEISSITRCFSKLGLGIDFGNVPASRLSLAVDSATLQSAKADPQPFIQRLAKLLTCHATLRSKTVSFARTAEDEARLEKQFTDKVTAQISQGKVYPPLQGLTISQLADKKLASLRQVTRQWSANVPDNPAQDQMQVQSPAYELLIYLFTHLSTTEYQALKATGRLELNDVETADVYTQPVPPKIWLKYIADTNLFNADFLSKGGATVLSAMLQDGVGNNFQTTQISDPNSIHYRCIINLNGISLRGMIVTYNARGTVVNAAFQNMFLGSPKADPTLLASGGLKLPPNDSALFLSNTGPAPRLSGLPFTETLKKAFELDLAQSKQPHLMAVFGDNLPAFIYSGSQRFGSDEAMLDLSKFSGLVQYHEKEFTSDGFLEFAPRSVGMTNAQSLGEENWNLLTKTYRNGFSHGSLSEIASDLHALPLDIDWNWINNLVLAVTNVLGEPDGSGQGIALQSLSPRELCCLPPQTFELSPQTIQIVNPLPDRVWHYIHEQMLAHGLQNNHSDFDAVYWHGFPEGSHTPQNLSLTWKPSMSYSLIIKGGSADPAIEYREQKFLSEGKLTPDQFLKRVINNGKVLIRSEWTLHILDVSETGATVDQTISQAAVSFLTIPGSQLTSNQIEQIRSTLR